MEKEIGARNMEKLQNTWNGKKDCKSVSITSKLRIEWIIKKKNTLNCCIGARQRLFKRFDRMARVELKCLQFWWLVLYYVQQTHRRFSSSTQLNCLLFGIFAVFSTARSRFLSLLFILRRTYNVNAARARNCYEFYLCIFIHATDIG